MINENKALKISIFTLSALTVERQHSICILVDSFVFRSFRNYRCQETPYVRVELMLLFISKVIQ